MRFKIKLYSRGGVRIMDTFSVEKTLWVRNEGSWGTTKPEKVTMSISAKICHDSKTGCFEMLDLESCGDRYYGAGGIWLNNDGFICDYDGVFSLDMTVLKWLDSIGCVSKDNDDYFRQELIEWGNGE
jgi:hypothetical protein